MKDSLWRTSPSAMHYHSRFFFFFVLKGKSFFFSICIVGIFFCKSSTVEALYYLFFNRNVWNYQNLYKDARNLFNVTRVRILKVVYYASMESIAVIIVAKKTLLLCLHTKRIWWFTTRDQMATRFFFMFSKRIQYVALLQLHVWLQHVLILLCYRIVYVFSITFCIVTTLHTKYL